MATKKRRKQAPGVVKTASRVKTVLGKETKDLVSVRSTVDPGVRFFVAQEQADDAIVASELAGKMVDKCVYEFPARGGGDPVRGLTIVGIREAMRLINQNPKTGMKITLDHSRMFVSQEIYDDEKGILVRCYAYDHISGAGNWGVKFETFNKKKSGGGTYKDTFVIEKATSKAIRNAIAGLIPIVVKLKMIDTFVEKGSVQVMPAPKEVSQIKTPIKDIKPTTPDELIKIIDESIDKLKDPDALETLAVKIEGTPKLSAAQKQMLMNKARGKANKLIDDMIKA